MRIVVTDWVFSTEVNKSVITGVVFSTREKLGGRGVVITRMVFSTRAIVGGWAMVITRKVFSTSAKHSLAAAAYKLMMRLIM